VAAHDDMTREELGLVAAIMGVVKEDGDGDVEVLADMIFARMRRVTLIVSAIVQDLSR
jgi:hypothetical protein